MQYHFEAATEVAGETTLSPTTEISGPDSSGTDFRLILYNDDWHGFEEVVLQVMKACGCEIREAARITEEAHLKGRAVALRGDRERCHQAARILREIRIQCEVDAD